MSAGESVEAMGAVEGRRGSLAAIAALRPQQWTKNLLLFAGIVFAAELGDPVRWLQAGAAFGVYCAASSACYLLNDIVDRDVDRTHPLKRLRPVASGELAVPTAAWLAAGLVGGALALALPLGPSFLAWLLVFLALQAAYTLRLKHVVLVDVMVIAALFVVRAAAGAEAVQVRISPWLLACTGLLALFLALGKRRGELRLVAAQETRGRRVLRGYSLQVLDPLIVGVAAAAVTAYTLYVITASRSPALALTIPLVAYGLVRYIALVRRDRAGEEPDTVLVTDRRILLTVALWAAACAALPALP